MADSVKISIVNDPKKFRFLLPYARSKLAQVCSHCEKKNVFFQL